ncbi:alpha/beta hydrolase [Photobacterium sp. TY1-4]|uniref:alpha/beta hydrolase n=1 Tax=Photobacterium sp. TY1-4 TaxID=2899122 RepID=UPI0021C23600|nr:alpha/beta hydrolase [Photobacterium sp. TY1-4]UXI04283.1 alpha/beta hydrolase [Photobacterium sp. TY1-4]
MATPPPALRTWLEQFNTLLRQSEQAGISPTPALARQGLAGITAQFVTHAPDIARVIDGTIHQSPIPCRIYHPAPETELPVVLFYHGGGHMCGNIAVYDPICRKLAHHSQAIVVSIDYRLAPEHPYPAGVDDAILSLRQLFPTLDQNQIRYRRSLTLAGDSAGGALAATVVQSLNSQTSRLDHESSLADQPPSVDKLVLIYPSLDYTLTADSLRENHAGYVLETNKIEWYFRQYLQHRECRESVSPLYGDIPPAHPETLIITAGFCPIKDDGLHYHFRLQRAGTPSRHLHQETMVHAYLNLETLVPEACQQTYQAIGDFIQQSRS